MATVVLSISSATASPRFTPHPVNHAARSTTRAQNSGYVNSVSPAAPTVPGTPEEACLRRTSVNDAHDRASSPSYATGCSSSDSPSWACSPSNGQRH